jgi:hypothetical protein
VNRLTPVTEFAAINLALNKMGVDPSAPETDFRAMPAAVESES